MTPDTNAEIVIASLPDREEVVAEIWIGSRQFAELRHEKSQYVCEIYPAGSGEPWTIEYDELLRVLSGAKLRLLGSVS